jgi:hypothetical protein
LLSQLRASQRIVDRVLSITLADSTRECALAILHQVVSARGGCGESLSIRAQVSATGHNLVHEPTHNDLVLFCSHARLPLVVTMPPPP